MRDMHSALVAVLALDAAVYSADAQSIDIDLQGYNASELVLSIGEGGITFSGSNKIEFKLLHSDDGVTFINVTDSDMLGVADITDGIIKSLTSAHNAADVYRFGYKGNKRYLRVVADFSGTHGAGTPFSAIILKSHGYDNPQADQA